MPSWIESHTALRTHKKLKPLADELGIPRAHAIGTLHCLWWWAIEHREDGDLNNLYEHDIAQAADWPGDAHKLIAALKKHGWITPDMHLNDWLDYAGRLVRERERKRKSRQQEARGGELFDAAETSAQAPKDDEIKPQEVVASWNEICVDLPKVVSISKQRIQHIRARNREIKTIEKWREIFQRVQDSPFCRGEEGGTGWEASLDWIIGNDTNWIKVMEGRYDERKGRGSVQTAPQGNKHLSPAVRAELERTKTGGASGVRPQRPAPGVLQATGTAKPVEKRAGV